MTFPASIEVWLLAHRQVASRPLDFFIKNSIDSIAKGTSPQEDDLKRTVNMECHDGSQRFNAPELMKEALVAVFIVRQAHSLERLYFQLNIKVFIFTEILLPYCQRCTFCHQSDELASWQLGF